MNLLKQGTSRRKDTLIASQSSIGDRTSYVAPGGQTVVMPPKQNASNNENGDEFFKVHGAHGSFKCLIGCKACIYQAKEEAKTRIGTLNPIDEYIAESEDVKEERFQWLMEHLLPPVPTKFKGCELIFPDTAFFEAGQAKSIIKNDEDYCLTQVKNPNKLTNTAIFTAFTTVIRERRNDQNGVFSQIYHKNFQLQAINRLQTRIGANDQAPG